MYRSVRSPLFLVCLFAAVVQCVPAAHAQRPGRQVAVSDTVWRVELTDGTSLTGRVVAVAGDRIVIETRAGARVEFERAQIRFMSPARGSQREGEFWREDPNQSRLFVAPTARTIPAGQGYFGVLEVFVPFAGFGFTDRFSILAGAPFYLYLAGEETVPWYIAPKLQVLRRERVQVSIGALSVFVPDLGDLGDGGSAGILFGVGSFGDADQALTTGIGWGYVDDEVSSSPVLLLGGESRVSRNMKLITENWILPEDGAAVSGGIRFIGERLSADAGLVGFLGEGSGCCFPLVNFVYTFGGD